MRIDKYLHEEVVLFSFEGRLESITYDTFESLVLDDEDVKKAKGVVLNFKLLKYVSSSGIRSIFEIRSKLTNQNKKLVLSQASANIIQVFNLLGVWPSFTYVSELDAAIQSAKG